MKLDVNIGKIESKNKKAGALTHSGPKNKNADPVNIKLKS
jgi:hypothetical protein